MRNCEEMTRLISESMDRELSFMEKFEMSVHTMMCKGCHNFKQNTAKLRSITHQHNTQAHSTHQQPAPKSNTPQQPKKHTDT